MRWASFESTCRFTNVHIGSDHMKHDGVAIGFPTKALNLTPALFLTMQKRH